MKIFLRILDFAAMFAMIVLCCLFAFIIEGDFMNVIGVIAGSFLAWICWEARI